MKRAKERKTRAAEAETMEARASLEEEDDLEGEEEERGRMREEMLAGKEA